MATMTPTSAELLYDGRMVIVEMEANTPADFAEPDWLAGLTAGKTAWLMVDGVQKQLRYACTTLHSNVADVDAATYDHATKTVTKAGAFANYVHATGNRVPFGKTTGATVTDASLEIASTVSDDAITLVTSIGASVTGTSLYSMDAGQGTKLVWRVAFEVIETAPVGGSAVVTFNCHAGLIADRQSNTSGATYALSVTNHSRMASDGFLNMGGFSRGTGGVTVYVAPGYGSDANTFAQSQNTATPYATVKKAIDELYGNSKVGTGSAVLLLEGTTDTSASTQLKVDGQDIDHPFLFATYWDAGAGVGTEGVRPIFPGGLTTSGAGGSATNLDFIVIRGIDFYGSSTTATALNLTRNSKVILDDCVFRNWAVGLSANCNDTGYATLLADRWLVNRCVFKDIYSTSGNAMGLYSQYVKRMVVRGCTFEFTGRKNSDGFGSDGFSRSIYHDSESDPIYNVGNFISRSDGIQNRPGGCILDFVFSESHIVGYNSGFGGRLARAYAEYGAAFGTTSFATCSYVHSTRTLTKTGIGSGLTSRCSIYAVSGTGVTSDQYRISSVAADSVVLASPGLGAGADGAADITAVVQNSPRGFGPEIVTSTDIRRTWTGTAEQFVMNRINKYGGNARSMTAGSYSSTFGNNKEYIYRNFTAFDTAEQMDAYFLMTDALKLNRVALDRYVSDLGTYNSCSQVHSATLTGWTWLSSDNNILKTSLSASRRFQVVGSLYSTADFTTLTGTNTNSSGTATLTYTDNTADLSDWANDCGLTATVAALRTALRDRALDAWPSCADMGNCYEFMAAQYEVLTVNGGANTVGSGPLGFYGAGDGTDPTEYPLPPDAPTLVYQESEVGVQHATQATFGWTAASGITDYRFKYGTVAGTYTTTEDVAAVTIALTGLSPQTTYYGVVVSVDSDGVESQPTDEFQFTTGPQGAPQTDGSRINLTSGSNRTTSGNAWSNPDRVDGPDSGDFANVSLTNQISDALTGTIPATSLEGVLVGAKFGVKGYTAAAPDATATFSFSLGNVAQGIGGSTNGDPLPPTTTETEYEVDVVLTQGTWAGLQAAIAAGMTAGVGESLSVVALNSGLTPTDFRVTEAWLVPVLAEESSGDVGGDEDAVDDLLLCGGW